MTTTKVLIVGSCVSRDPFGVRPQPGGEFAVADYYARTSFASLACRPAPDHLDLFAIASDFQRRMVARDLSKDLFQALESVDHDVVLLDFIDDRFSLTALSDGSAVTDSNEFRAAKLSLSQHQPRTVKAFSEEFRTLWATGWKRFLARMTELGRKDRILVNRVFWSVRDEQGNAMPNPAGIATANQYLAGVYERISDDLAPDQFISYEGLEFVGSTEHKWGVSPFHYVAAIEQVCLREVKRFHLTRTP